MSNIMQYSISNIAAEIEESRGRCEDNHFRVVTVLRDYFLRGAVSTVAPKILISAEGRSREDLAS